MGADLSYRARVEFMLKQIFGETFAKSGYWYMHPNPDAFFAMVMNIAGAGSNAKTNDGAELFKLKNGTSYEVNKSKLKALGVTEKKLRDLFAATPAADQKVQTTPVKSIWVPSPGFDVEDRSHDETEALVAIMDIGKVTNERKVSSKREAPSTSGKSAKRTKKAQHRPRWKEISQLDQLAELSNQVVSREARGANILDKDKHDEEDGEENAKARTANEDEDDEDDAIPTAPLTGLDHLDDWDIIAEDGTYSMSINDTVDHISSLAELHSQFFMVPTGFQNAQCSKERFAEDENASRLLEAKNDLLTVEMSLEHALTHGENQMAKKHLEALRDIVSSSLSKYTEKR